MGGSTSILKFGLKIWPRSFKRSLYNLLESFFPEEQRKSESQFRSSTNFSSDRNRNGMIKDKIIRVGETDWKCEGVGP
jgi:hypothetical protein